MASMESIPMTTDFKCEVTDINWVSNTSHCCPRFGNHPLELHFQVVCETNYKHKDNSFSKCTVAHCLKGYVSIAKGVRWIYVVDMEEPSVYFKIYITDFLKEITRLKEEI